jgi:hypothetical protein
MVVGEAFPKEQPLIFQEPSAFSCRQTLLDMSTTRNTWAIPVNIKMAPPRTAVKSDLAKRGPGSNPTGPSRPIESKVTSTTTNLSSNANYSAAGPVEILTGPGGPAANPDDHTNAENIYYPGYSGQGLKVKL